MDWMTTGEVALLANRSEAMVRRAASGDGLGPLVRQESSPRGSYYLLHPVLAEPARWRDIMGSPGARRAPRPGDDELIALCHAVMLASERESVWREAAVTLRAMREHSPVLTQRVTDLLRRLEPHERTAEVVELGMAWTRATARADDAHVVASPVTPQRAEAVPGGAG